MHTKWTNDLGLGYARAKKALSCIYTVGFYVDEYVEDAPRSVVVEVLRDGMRAIHPSKYVVRSPGARRESVMTAAWNAPEMFRTGVVRAHVFPIRPVAKDKWEVLLAVRFPISITGSVDQPSRREFGGILKTGSRVAHRFNRRVTVRPLEETGELEHAFTYVERLRLKPGEYDLTVLMSETDSDQQHVDHTRVVVPKVHRKGLFVAGPTLGRAVGDELVVFAEGGDPSDDRRAGPGSFTPLLVQYVEEPLDLVFLSDACLVGSDKAEHRVEQRGTTVQRGLNSETRAVASIPPVPLDLEGVGKVRCQSIVDVLPSSILVNGEFVFETRVGDESGQVSFAVELD